jgi:hypothetical protein
MAYAHDLGSMAKRIFSMIRGDASLSGLGHEFVVFAYYSSSSAFVSRYPDHVPRATLAITPRLLGQGRNYILQAFGDHIDRLFLNGCVLIAI